MHYTRTIAASVALASLIAGCEWVLEATFPEPALAGTVQSAEWRAIDAGPYNHGEWEVWGAYTVAQVNIPAQPCRYKGFDEDGNLDPAFAPIIGECGGIFLEDTPLIGSTGNYGVGVWTRYPGFTLKRRHME